MEISSVYITAGMALFVVVCTYFLAYIHLRFKHSVLGTHLNCLGYVV